MLKGLKVSTMHAWMFVSSWTALLAQTSPSAKQYQLPTLVYHTTTKIDLHRISGNWVRCTPTITSGIPLPALCKMGFYQALCWRAVHTEGTSKHALQVFLVPHGSAQSTHCTYYSQNSSSQRIYAQPRVHLSHVCMLLPSNPGVRKAYLQCTATISQLALQQLGGPRKATVRGTKSVWQKLKLFGWFWTG